MYQYIEFIGIKIYLYGFMISAGIIIANIMVYIIFKINKLKFEDFIILESYAFFGGFTGAKILYIIVSFDLIDWNNIFKLSYFNQLMSGGFVFYGGLVGGGIFIFLAGKIHKIKVMFYLKQCIFILPLIHGFGRIGCFMAGCCYGIPYDGIFAVTFPENSFAVSGISLFPIQLVEAIMLLLIFAIILFLQLKIKYEYTIESYLISYSIIRFILENYRYDIHRGIFFGLSTSQWISIGIFLLAIAILIKNRIFNLKLK
ncbi:MAG: prolipoprotein diacylglyceryl transferase [Oscillospiraceae bacterium]|nr:prolipoprotein diacylglyceryl transferase [Oscillospiraceae bacterium]